ncbi:MAG: BatD family protein [Phycisphaerales bacterium]
MTPMLFMLRNALFVLAFACVPTVCSAQVSSDSDDIRVEAELTRSSVYVGDEVSYSVAVYNAINPEQPEIEFPDGVKAIFHGRSSQSFTSMQYENNRRRSVTHRSYIFQYTLTAVVEGEVAIPAPSVKENGKVYTGNATSFRSLLPSESQDDELIVNIERTKLYLNETIEVECEWLIGDNTSEFNFSSSIVPDSFQIRAQPAPSNFHQIEFPLNGRPIVGYVTSETKNGRQLSKFTFRFTITPTELGTHELGPLRTIFTRQSGTGSRYRAYAESETTLIEVIPVPADRRPEEYNGAIGEFELESRASNTRVNVGDPIGLTLRIRGQEPMTGVQDAPDLETIPSFAEHFKIDSDGWRESLPRREGVREYSTTIRALSDRVDQIPAIGLASFDPILGEYRVYQTSPIPLSVQAVREVTLADAIVSSGAQSPQSTERRSVEKIELTPAAPGLWAHGTANDLTRKDGFDLAGTLQRPVWIATIATPPSLYFAALVIAAYRRNRDPESLRLRRALSAARKYHGVDSLQCYLAHALDIDQDAVVASDVFLLPVSDSTRHELHARLIEAERPGPPPNGNPEACQSLLRSLHEQCLRATRGGER